MPVNKNINKQKQSGANRLGPGHKAAVDPACHAYVEAPQCKNGVCLVTWKPQRPSNAA